MKIITAKRMLLLVFISALTFAFINSLHKNRLEVFFDAPADNFFEIFYQSDKDPEKLISDRHFYPKGENVRVLFTLRRTDLDQLRLDPFDGASSMVLKRVVISSFFYSSTISGEDLFKRLKTVQMLDAPRMQGGNIVLSGNSYDPISVVDLKDIDRTFDYKNVILWVGVSLLALVLCLKASTERRVSSRKTFQILLISLVPTLLVVGVFYPGFMTYDTLHALRAARSSVTDAIWPPMVSYIWRPIDWLSTDPATMLFIQVWLFLFSLMLILNLLTQRLVFSICVVGLFFCVPALLGTIGAVWKDVLMAALLLAGMVLAFQVRRAASVRGATGYFLLSIVVLLLAAGSRHNAITAVVPMLLYASWALVDKLNFTSGLRRVAFAASLGVITVISVYSGKIFFDKYSVPELNALQGTGSFKPLVRGMDLFAASLCLNRNLLEVHSPRLTLDDIKKGFDPRHSNYSAEVFKKVDRLGSEDFDEIWWQTMREHPVCFLSNKFLLIKYVLGANSDEQFLLMTPVVNASEFGYFLPHSGFRDRLVNYASQVSDMYFLRPWVFFVLSFPAMVLLALKSRWRIEYFVIFASSMLYALGFFIFGNATDARLLFYSNALNFVFVCMAIEFCFREFFSRKTAGDVKGVIRSM